VEFLEEGGLAIGFTRDAKYEDMELTLSPGDRLVLYSDGILETVNGEGEPFGLDRLRVAVDRHRDKPLSTSLKELLLSVDQWRGRAEPDDDVSILALEWKDKAPGEDSIRPGDRFRRGIWIGPRLGHSRWAPGAAELRVRPPTLQPTSPISESHPQAVFLGIDGA